MELELIGAIIGFVLISVVVLIPVFKIVAPIFPFAYANARLRAMKAELLKKDEYEDLLKKPYNEIIYSLGKKSYPDLSNKLGADFTYASVETAFRSSLIKTIEKVKDLSPEQSKPFVKTLLSKYDIQLIQSFIRVSTTTYAARRDIFHETTIFSKDFLTKQNPTIDDLYNQLKQTIYEPIIAKHLEQLKKGQYKAFEEELDLIYFKRLLITAKTRESRSYAKMMIDFQNTVFALKGLTPIIPSGRIPIELLKGTQGVEDIAKKLKNYGYKVEAKNAETLERDFRRYIRKKGELFMSKNPLSESTIIGFLLLKIADIRALNVLLKMKYHKFDAEIIKEVNIF